MSLLRWLCFEQLDPAHYGNRFYRVRFFSRGSAFLTRMDVPPATTQISWCFRKPRIQLVFRRTVKTLICLRWTHMHCHRKCCNLIRLISLLCSVSYLQRRIHYINCACLFQFCSVTQIASGQYLVGCSTLQVSKTQLSKF